VRPALGTVARPIVSDRPPPPVAEESVQTVELELESAQERERHKPPAA
jgi:hypothetical protein